MKHGLGTAPIEPAYRKRMNELARLVDVLFNGGERPKRTGFILMFFPLEGDAGRCNYISNAERNDVIVMLKEQLAYFEGQSDNMTGHA